MARKKQEPEKKKAINTDGIIGLVGGTSEQAISETLEINYKEKNKEMTQFAYNEAEKAKILKSLEGKKVDIQRSKGLGENDPEMMWMTTMNPETRRLIKVMPEDAERTAMYFDMLLGDALQDRKNFIAENGARYLELADIS